MCAFQTCLGSSPHNTRPKLHITQDQCTRLTLWISWLDDTWFTTCSSTCLMTLFPTIVSSICNRAQREPRAAFKMETSRMGGHGPYPTVHGLHCGFPIEVCHRHWGLLQCAMMLQKAQVAGQHAQQPGPAEGPLLASVSLKPCSFRRSPGNGLE